MKRFTDSAKIVTGWTIMALLAAGGATAVAYAVAVIIGGDVGAAIVEFLYNNFFVWMTVVACVTVVFGMAIVYLTGEHDFVMERRKRGPRGGASSAKDEPSADNDGSDGGQPALTQGAEDASSAGGCESPADTVDPEGKK